VPVKQ